jgi:hypothetical protein
MQPSSLVQEAFLRLLPGAGWQDRVHFFAAASQVMRHVLVDVGQASAGPTMFSAPRFPVRRRGCPT